MDSGQQNFLKAIAVDDERHCLDTLLWELKRHCPEVQVIGEYQNPDKALDALQQAEIDVLFLDIHLQSTSGIELLKRLMPVDYHVIFVTAYDEYALQAFDLAATHYLLKPVNGKKLKEAVDRIKRTPPEISPRSMEALINTIRSEITSSKKVPFPVQNGIEFIDPKNIIYVQGDNNYSVIHLHKNKKLIVSKTLSHTEDALHPYASFLRIHKSYLINLKYIRRYNKTDGGYVEMESGQKLSVSRTRRMVLNELFR